MAETVTQAELAPGEPTRNFLTGMVTHPAYESDEEGQEKMAAEQAEMGLEKPPVQYVDGAYVSGKKLAEVQGEGRVLMGPAQPAPLAQSKGVGINASRGGNDASRRLRSGGGRPGPAALVVAGRSNVPVRMASLLRLLRATYAAARSW